MSERISLIEAEALLRSALAASGVADTTAHSVARALVAAESEGQVGHGFSRLEDYVAQVRSGKINATASMTMTMANTTSVVIDADCGFAYPALDAAIERGAEVARFFGTSTMSIFNSHHCGVLSIQVEKLAKRGLIGLMMANAPKAIAPWGASEPFFGTNPIAFAVPRKDEEPLVIDLSLSKVARGKVMHAKKSGNDIPQGWALDKDGNPTTDAQAALEGSMLPIGDAKGTALALMVEVLASVFTGAAMSHQAGSFFSAEGSPPRVGQFLMAINPERDDNHFADRLEQLLGGIEAMDGARLPGKRRLAQKAEADEFGIAVPAHYLEIARRLAAA